MRRVSWVSALLVIVACHRSAPVTSGPPSVLPVQRIVSGGLALELTGATARIHGDCPTECCRYGDWITPVTPVYDRPDTSGRRIGSTVRDEAVRADSGVVIVDRVGVAAVLRDTLLGPGVRLVSGDSLVLLTQGETGYQALWRGRLLLVELDDSAPGSIRIVRRPSMHRWWAHIVSKGRALHGWIDMDRAPVAGADACGRQTGDDRADLTRPPPVRVS